MKFLYFERMHRGPKGDRVKGSTIKEIVAEREQVELPWRETKGAENARREEPGR